MIKINGPNYPQGSGDDFIFGDFNGDGNRNIQILVFGYYFGNGSGKGIDSLYFSSSSGNGYSWSSHSLKEEFKKYD